MTGAPVISAYDVSKRFVTHRRRATSLKERVVKREGRIEHGDFWALRGVSLEIARGETVGLVGHNGSGKSTLLKLLAGIIQPTTGTVHTLGRVASLLELGAGFAAELSGSDNIYLNASLLGLSRAEIDGLYDDIVAFSELGDRISDPVKVYSSGMYVKLGFSIAVHVDPDILLIDEVLAVGDEAFQIKCLDKIEEFQSQGKTILVVSHALDQVVKLCNRAVVLDHGELQHDGDPTRGVELLRGLLGVAPMPLPPREVAPIEGVPERVGIAAVHVSTEPGGEPRYVFHPGEPLSVRVAVDVHDRGEATAGGEVTAVLMGPGQLPLVVMRGGGTGTVPPVPGHWVVDFLVADLPAVVGPLALAVSVSDPTTGLASAALTVEDALAVPGERANGLLDARVEVALHRGDALDRVDAPGRVDGPA